MTGTLGRRGGGSRPGDLAAHRAPGRRRAAPRRRRRQRAGRRARHPAVRPGRGGLPGALPRLAGRLRRAPTCTTRPRRSCAAVARLGRRGRAAPGRLQRQRAGRGAGGGLPGRPDRAPRQQQVGGRAGPGGGRRHRPGRAGLRDRDRPARGGGRAGADPAGVSSGSPPGSRRTPTSSSPPPTRTRSSASRWPPATPRRRSVRCSAAGPGAASACTATSARRSSTPRGFEAAAHRVVGLLGAIRDEHDLVLPELNLGGGFGIAYPADDDPVDVADVAAGLRAIVTASARRRAAGAAAGGRAGPGDRRSGHRHALRDRHDQAAAGPAQLRLRGRRDERQHPHRPLRRRLHLRAGQPGADAPPALCRVAASTARAATSWCATCGCPPTWPPVTCSRCRPPAPTAGRWPATTTTCSSRRWSRCRDGASRVLVRRQTVDDVFALDVVAA